MGFPRLAVVALPVIALAAMPLAAAVTVAYGDPDRFTDAGDRNTDPRNVMLELAKQLKTLGERSLPAGTNLRIEVLDLDRAGRPRGNLPGELRIMNGKGDRPCIDLTYSLESGGKARPPVREMVCDNDYLRPLEFRYDVHDPLAYEKRMLDEWFQRRFVKNEPPH
jgi:Protein of unknown function (DUF3016)